MKKWLYTLLLSLYVSGVISQNFVPNYSFEVHSNCPNEAGGISIHFATSWDGWDSADYFSIRQVSAVSVHFFAFFIVNGCF